MSQRVPWLILAVLVAHHEYVFRRRRRAQFANLARDLLFNPGHPACTRCGVQMARVTGGEMSRRPGPLLCPTCARRNP